MSEILKLDKNSFLKLKKANANLPLDSYFSYRHIEIFEFRLKGDGILVLIDGSHIPLGIVCKIDISFEFSRSLRD